jgi:hypothetical protein
MLRAVCWKNKQEVYVLSNMHIPPAEGNLKEGGKAVKSLIIEDYTTHMICIGLKATALARKPGNGQKKPLHLLDLTILNSYILC